jgi:hypothetical protein
MTMTQKDDGMKVANSRKVPKVTISLKYIYLAQIKYIILSGIYGIGGSNYYVIGWLVCVGGSWY